MVDADVTTLEEMAAAGSHGPPLATRVRLGLLVTAGLTVLTIIEYVIAVRLDEPLLWLLPFAVAKFLLILEYFMHFSALFGKGGH
jgi:hypothetical protein